ncbi:MAG: tRNA uridine-5-carboxymethylaminomethyl(34) synthesis GTPase MnmE [Magnetovibrio sp.]|nr:tRNA uridine-5-carboxymethylaminomethyl(34) synthesis GTPase MnmE [Magnetovibrio sp.]
MAQDTIFALASGFGRAGVAVVRVSGPTAQDAVIKLLDRDLPPRKAVRVKLAEENGGPLIDQAIALFFPGPSSYTGEDVLELHIHGGLAVIEGVLAALGQLSGFRIAEPGEFTRRSFENGKIDLTGAEGIADLIEAETAMQRSQALRQIDGALAKFIERCREHVMVALAHWEAAIDFLDEELPEDLEVQVFDEILSIVNDIKSQLDDGYRGEILRHGIKVVILGPPNAGKSSLLNLLAKRDVAIVSEVAGTTRDVIEIRLDLGGYPAILADTAGLYEADSELEQESMRRSRAAAESADILLFVIDGSSRAEVDEIISASAHENALLIINKADLMQENPPAKIQGHRALAMSAKTGAGLDAVLAELEKRAAKQAGGKTAPLVTRQRHREALRDAHEALERFLKLSCRPNLPELAAEDLRLAARALGRITGTVDVEDLLEIIFSDFCIGK